MIVGTDIFDLNVETIIVLQLFMMALRYFGTIFGYVQSTFYIFMRMIIK